MFRKGFLLREEVPEGEEKTRLTLIQEAGLLVWLGRGQHQELAERSIFALTVTVSGQGPFWEIVPCQSKVMPHL